MASSRKRQDEKNIKTLRELGALPQNKYCFDCNQRGPTYVNITIGSFVCTKCSGMLRGLTPPHRVKSISMATFTTEEVDLLRIRGNEHCRSVWLGLYECSSVDFLNLKDAQSIRDFMVEKYERRRYYLDPDADSAPRNGARGETKVLDPDRKREARKNGSGAKSEIKVKSDSDAAFFKANFDDADIFNDSKGTRLVNGGFSMGNFQKTSQSMDSFADFDAAGLEFEKKVSCAAGSASMAAPQTFDNDQNRPVCNGTVRCQAEDKYAALKDLDNEIKSKKSLEWNSTGSDGSLYGSSTPTGSVYSSPSPQNSIFGSPSQGQTFVAFPAKQGTVPNPFGNGSASSWASNFNEAPRQQPNPFQGAAGQGSDFSDVFQPIAAVPVNGWTSNPFTIAASASFPTNFNNPFL